MLQGRPDPLPYATLRVAVARLLTDMDLATGFEPSGVLGARYPPRRRALDAKAW